MLVLISRSHTSRRGLILAATLTFLLNGCAGNGAFDPTRKQISTAISGVVSGASGAIVEKKIGCNVHARCGHGPDYKIIGGLKSGKRSPLSATSLGRSGT
jgi:hypothetical protein